MKHNLFPCCVSPGVAITNCHKLEGLKQQKCASHSSGGQSLNPGVGRALGGPLLPLPASGGPSCPSIKQRKGTKFRLVTRSLSPASPPPPALETCTFYFRAPFKGQERGARIQGGPLLVSACGSRGSDTPPQPSGFVVSRSALHSPLSSTA